MKTMKLNDIRQTQKKVKKPRIEFSPKLKDELVRQLSEEKAVDRSMLPVLQQVNSMRSFATLYSCSGHLNHPDPRGMLTIIGSVEDLEKIFSLVSSASSSKSSMLSNIEEVELLDLSVYTSWTTGAQRTTGLIVRFLGEGHGKTPRESLAPLIRLLRENFS